MKSSKLILARKTLSIWKNPLFTSTTISKILYDERMKRNLCPIIKIIGNISSKWNMWIICHNMWIMCHNPVTVTIPQFQAETLLLMKIEMKIFIQTKQSLHYERPIILNIWSNLKRASSSQPRFIFFYCLQHKVLMIYHLLHIFCLIN